MTSDRTSDMTSLENSSETSFGKNWKNRVRKYRKPFFILFIYELAVCLPLLVLRLTNDLDGLWNQDDYVAGAWELSIGRWFWPFLDKARFGVSLDPLPALAALALYAVSFLLILSLFGLSFSPLTALAGFLFLGSVGIVCQMSFGYMAITFAVSFFLAVLAVRVLPLPENRSRFSVESVKGATLKESAQYDSDQKKTLLRKDLIRVLTSSVCIALMMGCYQAGIGTTALLILMVLLYSLSASGSAESTRRRLRFLLDSILSVLLGGVLYVLMLKLRLWQTGTAASDYQGFSSISPAYLLAAVPGAVRHCYQSILNYFVNGTFLSHALEGHRWFVLFFLPFLALCLSLFVRIFRRSKKDGIFFLLGISVIPIAANCFYLAAPETETHMQMTVSMALILPLLLCMSRTLPLPFFSDKVRKDIPTEKEGCSCESKKRETVPSASSFSKASKAFSALLALCTAVLIYGDILQCEMDQYAMYAGRRATQTLAESILAEADRQGYDYLEGQILITGAPASSRTFYTAPLFERANSYAQYGRWSSDVSFSRVSWRKFYSNYLRVNVSFAVDDTEATIAALPEVAAMPSFPAPGSVQNIYGVLVVKLGE